MAGATTSFTFTATDDDGTVDSVEFECSGCPDWITLIDDGLGVFRIVIDIGGSEELIENLANYDITYKFFDN